MDLQQVIEAAALWSLAYFSTGLVLLVKFNRMRRRR